MKTQNDSIQASGSYITADKGAQIDWLIRRYDGKPHFSAMGHTLYGAGQCLESIAEAYPQDRDAMRLIEIWRKHHLKAIAEDTASAFAVTLPNNADGLSFYDRQTAAFLASNGVKLRATLSNSKTPAWGPNHGGNHYRVTLSGKCRRLTFDFWGSINDAQNGEDPSAYSILACISSDAYTSDTFADFCSEMGESEDSIKALQLFRRCSAFAKRLRAFFTEAELSQLSEIR